MQPSPANETSLPGKVRLAGLAMHHQLALAARHVESLAALAKSGLPDLTAQILYTSLACEQMPCGAGGFACLHRCIECIVDVLLVQVSMYGMLPGCYPK